MIRKSLVKISIPASAHFTDFIPNNFYQLNKILVKLEFLAEFSKKLQNNFQNWRSKITIMEFRGVLWRFIVLKLRLILKKVLMWY